MREGRSKWFGLVIREEQYVGKRMLMMEAQRKTEAEVDGPGQARLDREGLSGESPRCGNRRVAWR